MSERAELGGAQRQGRANTPKTGCHGDPHCFHQTRRGLEALTGPPGWATSHSPPQPPTARESSGTPGAATSHQGLPRTLNKVGTTNLGPTKGFPLLSLQPKEEWYAPLSWNQEQCGGCLSFPCQGLVPRLCSWEGEGLGAWDHLTAWESPK